MSRKRLGKRIGGRVRRRLEDMARRDGGASCQGCLQELPPTFECLRWRLALVVLQEAIHERH
jgi:hypothetical protein